LILLDQNISFRIIKSIEAFFPGASQVKQLGLQNANDREIWDFAKKNNYAIVTFDSDFGALSTLYGHPPKVIWLRTGNINTIDLIKFIQDHKDLILEFLTLLDYRDIACLELGE
jgi:predicted nuclease of predicted toxin-antitoxin system